jgi:hypothetical protein
MEAPSAEPLCVAENGVVVGDVAACRDRSSARVRLEPRPPRGSGCKGWLCNTGPAESQSYQHVPDLWGFQRTDRLRRHDRLIGSTERDLAWLAAGEGFEPSNEHSPVAGFQDGSDLALKRRFRTVRDQTSDHGAASAFAGSRTLLASGECRVIAQPNQPCDWAAKPSLVVGRLIRCDSEIVAAGVRERRGRWCRRRRGGVAGVVGSAQNVLRAHQCWL